MAIENLEESNILSMIVECFYYDSRVNIFPVNPHWHYYMEVIYIIEGQALMHSDETTLTANAGELVIFYPQDIHSIHVSGDSPLRYAVMKFDVNRFSKTSDYAPKLGSILKAAHKQNMPQLFDKSFCANANIRQIFDNCISEMNAQKYGYDVLVSSLIYELMITLIRHWQEYDFVIDSEAFLADEIFDIYNITGYINEHFGEGIQVQDIANHCNMSYSCFAKKFLSTYGMSCKDYMENLRVHRVEELLLFTDFDLNSISLDTGYSDCSHMIKSFKKKNGVTPRQYRVAKRA